ncbi:MAG: cofactor-independent phosphoglycerate mutase [Dissulfurispiraceae bacterium]|jgi:2,3-bisphosphoglycerate-independent phosphoglycerate mutase|nr:cofactor-independent phosphoglycerate mutase [Dissulfurispiraceae bacterium]
MKYVVIIGDGMADRPMDALGGLTPLMKAKTDNMDSLASQGVVGIVRTVPEGFHPGSDVANLSIMGYDPALYYSGRAPLEAASIGVSLDEHDVAYRCNLVTLRYSGADRAAVMDDYSSGHITTEEAQDIMAVLQDELGTNVISFFPGVSYRHLMVWKNGDADIKTTPPHDILGKEAAPYMPSGKKSEVLRDLMSRSTDILQKHPVNKSRINANKKPANSIWLWGQGRKPDMPTYMEKYGITGALISAVDLTKGLGIYAGLKVLDVPGATGWIDTNYEAKTEYALNALESVDFVYLHVEAPDEAGHSGKVKDKIKAIEDLDSRIVGPMLAGLKERFPEHRVLLMPDHATPVDVRTHTEEPVPFALFDSTKPKNNGDIRYNESIAQLKEITRIDKGFTIMDYLIKET